MTFEPTKRTITCHGETHSLDGVHVSVEDGAVLQSRVAFTRLLALGVFALAVPKLKGGDAYVAVQGPDFAWVAHVDRKHVAGALNFANAVNQVAEDR